PPSPRRRRALPRWRAELGGRPALGSPPVVDGRVIVAVERDDGRRGALAAFDLASGEPTWTVERDAAIKHMPAAAEDVVIALTCTGTLVAVDAGTGERLWDAVLGDGSTRWCWGGPLVHEGTVYAGTAGRFGAFSRADGECRWRHDDLAHDDWMPAPGRPAVAGDSVVATFRNERAHVCAFDAATGEPRWRRRCNELTAPPSGPAGADGLGVA